MEAEFLYFSLFPIFALCVLMKIYKNLAETNFQIINCAIIFLKICFPNNNTENSDFNLQILHNIYTDFDNILSQNNVKKLEVFFLVKAFKKVYKYLICCLLQTSKF